MSISKLTKFSCSFPFLPCVFFSFVGLLCVVEILLNEDDETMLHFIVTFSAVRQTAPMR